MSSILVTPCGMIISSGSLLWHICFFRKAAFKANPFKVVIE
ncbi:hypothetical protein [Bacteroides uniformis]|nr:hypothetical protein [Bacteroides uniformis]MCQ5351709.1 hypothetical protein [Bacteroides uniformis]